MPDAEARLQGLAQDCFERTKDRATIHQLSAVQWPEIRISVFDKPKTWRMCQYIESKEGMVEASFRLQGIMVEKDLPPLNVNSNSQTMRRGRRYLRQHVKLIGGDTESFAEVLSSMNYAFICFSGHFNEGQLEEWKAPQWQDQVGIDASTRYMTHKSQCLQSDITPFAEYVDPSGQLAALMGNDFAHTIDNEVTYMEAFQEEGVPRYRVVSPTAFKIGDIVEAVVALVCYPTGKEGKAKMSVALRGLSLLDRTERDKAAILRMKNRHISRSLNAVSELKRRFAYEDDDEDPTGHQKLARMAIDDQNK
ncbi:hypothetical protein NMY22_g7669 [Coprinellus aureogranulatus]|nr:hypothetical protein NMY22_g7669 [Coprinellus aureogranulatus]